MSLFKKVKKNANTIKNQDDQEFNLDNKEGQQDIIIQLKQPVKVNLNVLSFTDDNEFNQSIQVKLKQPKKKDKIQANIISLISEQEEKQNENPQNNTNIDSYLDELRKQNEIENQQAKHYINNFINHPDNKMEQEDQQINNSKINENQIDNDNKFDQINSNEQNVLQNQNNDDVELEIEEKKPQNKSSFEEEEEELEQQEIIDQEQILLEKFQKQIAEDLNSEDDEQTKNMIKKKKQIKQELLKKNNQDFISIQHIESNFIENMDDKRVSMLGEIKQPQSKKDLLQYIQEKDIEQINQKMDSDNSDSEEFNEFENQLIKNNVKQPKQTMNPKKKLQMIENDKITNQGPITIKKSMYGIEKVTQEYIIEQISQNLQTQEVVTKEQARKIDNLKYQIEQSDKNVQKYEQQKIDQIKLQQVIDEQMENLMNIKEQLDDQKITDEEAIQKSKEITDTIKQYMENQSKIQLVN